MVHNDKQTFLRGLTLLNSDASFCRFGRWSTVRWVFLYFTTFTSHSFISFLTNQMKGLVSIFQLLGRYIRLIWWFVIVITYACLFIHKQPVRLKILRNFEVQKPRARKTRLTEPLRSNIEPHCGIIEPLRRKIEHLSSKGNHDCLSQCGNVESVYGVNKSFFGKSKPCITRRKNLSNQLSNYCTSIF